MLSMHGHFQLQVICPQDLNRRQAPVSERSVFAGEGLVSKPYMLLGHFSSIVTTLTARMMGTKSLLVSTDREGKVRVSKLPKDMRQA